MAIARAEAVPATDRRLVDLTELRRASCATCPELRRIPALPDTCRKCGCIVFLKTALTTQMCPIGRW